jgi:hypothetical protein
MKRRDKGRLPSFVPLFKETLATPAWRKLSHGARSLYVALKLRHIKNNGRVYLATRDAAKELGSGLEEIGNWFRELQHYGFIVMTRPGYLGLDGKGLAPHWRLTEVGYMNDPPGRHKILPTQSLVQAVGATEARIGAAETHKHGCSCPGFGAKQFSETLTKEDTNEHNEHR